MPGGEVHGEDTGDGGGTSAESGFNRTVGWLGVASRVKRLDGGGGGRGWCDFLCASIQDLLVNGGQR